MSHDNYTPPRLAERVTVARCIGCENHLTGDTIDSNDGKLRCPRCGCTIRAGQIETYIREGATDE